MDEFGSTVPEHEAYALSRALLEFFRDAGSKTLFSTHNEELLRKMEEGAITGTVRYHVPITVEGAGKVRYSRKLQK
jgi:DNA mismatch repair ATPase MutS